MEGRTFRCLVGQETNQRLDFMWILFPRRALAVTQLVQGRIGQSRDLDGRHGPLAKTSRCHFYAPRLALLCEVPRAATHRLHRDSRRVCYYRF